MSKNMAETNRTRQQQHNRRRHRKVSNSSFSADREPIPLRNIPIKLSPRTHVAVSMSSAITEIATNNTSPLLEIIQRKQRKDWAKIVAPIEDNQVKAHKEFLITRLMKTLPTIPTPTDALLTRIEYRHGFTIRSYFELIIWLFYLNLFTFIICFAFIILPTYVYSNAMSFDQYASNLYNETFANFSPSIEYHSCRLEDDVCQQLNVSSNASVISNETCFDNPYSAARCCSLHVDEYFNKTANESRSPWTEFLSSIIDGTGYFTLSPLFMGYYRNMTRVTDDRSDQKTYNMGLAVFLTVFICLLITGIITIRKYGHSIEKSYVDSESSQNRLFEYVFGRWDFNTKKKKSATRQKNTFYNEVDGIMIERNGKVEWKLDTPMAKILFQTKRILLWLVTLIMFGGAIAAVYFANQFTFKKQADKEAGSDSELSNRALDMAIEYLPTAVISFTNIFAQMIFAFMRDLNLYTRATSIRHYLMRVILMRLVLLFSFIFIVILQITCNKNPCAKQLEIAGCGDINDRNKFIHCWETLLGQVFYRLVIMNSFVMIVIHIIVDPIRSLFIRCCAPKVKRDLDKGTETPQPCFLCVPLTFELSDYVIDLTYAQTLCWHGFLFCPYLSLMAAIANILTFAVKFLSLNLFRRESSLALSPAQTRSIFTAVLLLSFIWALLPIAFIATSLQPSHGCGPFRIYNDDSPSYMYYALRNLILMIPNNIVIGIFIKISSAVVIVPLVLILILISCLLAMRRNSYRGVNKELLKLLCASQKTHQIALKGARSPTVAF